MNLEEFETQYRRTIEESLNQLQTAVLLVARLEAKIATVGQDLQNLSQIVEEFITEQRTE
jgi:exonuclease VII small subunit